MLRHGPFDWSRGVALVVAISACVPFAGTADAAPPTEQPTWSTERIIVKFRKELIERARATGARRAIAVRGSAVMANATRTSKVAQDWGVTRVTRAYPYEFRYPELAARFGLDRTYVMEVPSGTDTRALAAAMRACAEEVETAGVDPIGRESCPPDDATPDDPLFAAQYALPRIDAPDAWDLHTGDLGSVTIAIIDSGLNTGAEEHPEFAGRVLPGINAAEQPGTPNENVTEDATGHGTHVAGIAAAEGCNAQGIAGVTWGAYLLPVRIVPVGGGDVTSLRAGKGLIWATDQSADICNVSQEFYIASEDPGELSFLIAAVGYAHDSGVLVVAAAGNQSENHPAYPARSAKCMAVSATDTADGMYSLSNTGCELDVAAPGVEICSTDTDTTIPVCDALHPRYRTRTGTSMSSPLVAGLAALMKSYNPALTNVDLRNIINATADDLGPAGWDNQFGYGRINALRAMQAAFPALSIVSSSPPDGAIDARIPFDSDGSNPHGWQTLEVTFDGDASSVVSDDFVVIETGSDVACVAAGPSVASVTPHATDPATVLLTLQERMQPQTWIKLSHTGSGDTICLGMLPGDVSAGRRTDRGDITALRSCLDDGGTCPLHRCDIDRQGSCTAADLAALVDLLNGSGSLGSWSSATVGLSPCSP